MRFYEADKGPVQPGLQNLVRRVSRGVARRSVAALDRAGIPHLFPRDLVLERAYQTRRALRRGDFARRVIEARSRATDLPYRRVLFPTLAGAGPLVPYYEYPIASALRLRGASVVALICDDAPHCDFELLDAFGLDSVRTSQLVSAETREEIERAVAATPDAVLEDFRWRGFPLGRLIRTYPPNVFRAKEFAAKPETPNIARRSLVTSAVYAAAADALLREGCIDKIVLQNGQALMGSSTWAVARRHGVPVDVWEFHARAGTISFRHDPPATHGDLGDDWDHLVDVPLTLYHLRDSAELMPGRDPDLDVVCDGILRGTPFLAHDPDATADTERAAFHARAVSRALPVHADL